MIARDLIDCEFVLGVVIAEASCLDAESGLAPVSSLSIVSAQCPPLATKFILQVFAHVDFCIPDGVASA